MEKPDIELMKKERDVDGLIRILQEDSRVDVRFEVINALAALKDRAAVEPLIKAVNEDPDGGIRLRAVWALGEIRDERAVEPLIDKLNKIETFWRPNVIYALGEIGDKRAIKPLQRYLSDGDQRVRTAANEALKKLQETNK